MTDGNEETTASRKVGDQTSSDSIENGDEATPADGTQSIDSPFAAQFMWPAITAIACLLIAASLTWKLFDNGYICSAELGEEYSFAACSDQKSLDELILETDVGDKEAMRKLASAIAADEGRAEMIANEIKLKHPDKFLEIAGVEKEAKTGTLFSLGDTKLIDNLVRQLEDLRKSNTGPDRHDKIDEGIRKVKLWHELRIDAKGRQKAFSPVSDAFEATQPRNAPEACTIRSKASKDYAPFSDGDFIFVESEDGSRAIVREVFTDPLDGAFYQFHVTPDDAKALRLIKTRRGTRGKVFAKLATAEQRANLYDPCVAKQPEDSA